MKRILSFLMVILFFQIAVAQDSTVIKLWPGKVPGQTEIKQPSEATYISKSNEVRLVKVTDPTLTVFEPEPGKRNGAGIIVSPGGAYSFLAATKEGYEIAHWLNSLGFTAFVLSYRVPDNRAGALQDAQRAIRVVRARAAEWKLDTDKIGVMGFSAGGSLSARISTQYLQDWYRPVDAADSVSSKPGFALLIYPAYLDEGENHQLTPELRVVSNTPPMFIFQTADDPYGNSSLVMAGALREAKVPVELHLYPIGRHGYGMRWGAGAKEWPSLAGKWLNKLLHSGD